MIIVKKMVNVLLSKNTKQFIVKDYFKLHLLQTIISLLNSGKIKVTNDHITKYFSFEKNS
jgi:hypothetical protein